MSENNQPPEGHRLVIEKTPDGRLHLQAPSDFLMCLGMLEWANKKLWEMHLAHEQKAKAGPTVQIPGLNIPRGRN